MMSSATDKFDIQEDLLVNRHRKHIDDHERSTFRRGITIRKNVLLFGIGFIAIFAVVAISEGFPHAINKNSFSNLYLRNAAPYETINEINYEYIRDSSSELSFEFNDGPFVQEMANDIRFQNEIINNAAEFDLEDERIADVCQTNACNITANTLIESMNTSVDPCMDFYEFACGGWYDSHPVTDESLGTFFAVADTVDEQLLAAMTASSDASDPLPVIDMRISYDTCLDTDTMDSLGLTPLWDQLNAPGQGGWPIVMDTWDETRYTIYEALVNIEKIGINPMIAIGISPDLQNTSYNILYISEGDLGLDPKFLQEPFIYQTQIEEYTEYIINSAKLIRDSIGSGVSDAQIAIDAEDIVNLEISLASAYQYIPLSIDDVIQKADVEFLQTITDENVGNVFNWMTYFHVLFQETNVIIDLDEPIYISGEPYYSLLNLLLYAREERSVANYIGWRWVLETGAATTYEMRALSETFQMQVNNVTSSDSRESHCVTQTQFNLAMPTSRAYVDGFFDTSSRPEISELVENIRSAFDTLLDNNTWMATDDLVVAKEKLAAILDRIAYPDWIMDNTEIELAYSGLNIINGEQYNNLIRMGDFYNLWNLLSFREQPTIGWSLPPTVVNAFYNVFSNSITILAAILQHPFFTEGSLAAANYGGVGMVIGHEMTHGFDNLGRRFDKDGNLVSWWSQESIDGFTERSQCFVEQYSSYSPPELEIIGDPMTVNGQQTLGENIADNGGIREAFLAYNSYVAQYGEEARLPGLEDYTPDQIFFLSFANLWCEHRTDEDLVTQINSDPHSPGRFRIIGSLSNDANFWDTYNCPESSAMNRGEDSCLLW